MTPNSELEINKQNNSTTIDDHNRCVKKEQAIKEEEEKTEDEVITFISLFTMSEFLLSKVNQVYTGVYFKFVQQIP